MFRSNSFWFILLTSAFHDWIIGFLAWIFLIGWKYFQVRDSFTNPPLQLKNQWTSTFTLVHINSEAQFVFLFDLYDECHSLRWKMLLKLQNIYKKNASTNKLTTYIHLINRFPRVARLMRSKTCIRAKKWQVQKSTYRVYCITGNAWNIFINSRHFLYHAIILSKMIAQ